MASRIRFFELKIPRVLPRKGPNGDDGLVTLFTGSGSLGESSGSSSLSLTAGSAAAKLTIRTLTLRIFRDTDMRALPLLCNGEVSSYQEGARSGSRPGVNIAVSLTSSKLDVGESREEREG